ncbi:DUF6173 family protein [Aestuariivita boseongensis]|uniref:DUF6173 family protein n=1 Tax=Aestuariivita boseongensis TaxID=1470562 RepID=UPI000AD50312|nr:DUF6173 family protein [Aestuariivita boseongensis]
MDNEIKTTAELKEDDTLPCVYEVHTDAGVKAGLQDLPEGMKAPVDTKSPARWAYERLILYIQNFEKHLDSEHEVAIGLTGGEIGVLRIEGMGYFDPDIVTFYGSDASGARTQLIQHVTQLNVMLRALPKRQGQSEPSRIGFRLAADLQKDGENP